MLVTVNKCFQCKFNDYFSIYLSAVIVSLVIPPGAVSVDRVIDEGAGGLEICSVLTGELDRSIVARLVVSSRTDSNGARCELLMIIIILLCTSELKLV